MYLQYELETFREHFRSVRAMVYEDYIVYKCKHGCAKRMAIEANELIESLGLDLVAIPTMLLANDSFIVQSNEVEV